MAMPPTLVDREQDKFVETPAGQTAVRTLIANDSTTPVEIAGSITASVGNVGVAAPTGPFKITKFDVTDTAQDPLPLPLSNRFGLSIRNRSQTSTVYIGRNALVTPDDSATGGWEVGPNEDFHIDLDDSNAFFLITPPGESAIVKILEIASSGVTSGGGGGGTLTRVREIPTGVVDGSNTAFTLSQAPASETYFTLFRNGNLLTPGVHYNRVGTSITMIVPPVVGQTLEAIYEY